MALLEAPTKRREGNVPSPGQTEAFNKSVGQEGGRGHRAWRSERKNAAPC